MEQQTDSSTVCTMVVRYPKAGGTILRAPSLVLLSKICKPLLNLCAGVPVGSFAGDCCAPQGMVALPPHPPTPGGGARMPCKPQALPKTCKPFLTCYASVLFVCR